MATWQVPKRYNNFPIKQLRESRGQSSDDYEEHDFMYCICLHDSTFFFLQKSEGQQEYV